MCGSPTDQWSAWITNWKVGEDYQPWEMKDRSTQDGNSMEFPGLLNSGWSMFEQIYQPVFASCQKRNLLPKMVALGVPNQLSQPVSTQSAWKIMTNWSASGYGWIYLHHDNLQNFYGWISSSIWMNIYIYIYRFPLKAPNIFGDPWDHGNHHDINDLNDISDHRLAWRRNGIWKRRWSLRSPLGEVPLMGAEQRSVDVVSMVPNGWFIMDGKSLFLWCEKMDDDWGSTHGWIHNNTYTALISPRITMVYSTVGLHSFAV